MNKEKYKPESLMMSHGYTPAWSEGAIKCPIFQTSTFVFETAEEGKAFFEIAYGKREQNPDEKLGLIYSRLNNPDLQILEERLTLWDGAEEGAVFQSGMSAITTVFLEFLRPGDLLVYSKPLYGGTSHFIHQYLSQLGVTTIGIHGAHKKDEIIKKIKASGLSNKLKLFFIETPANPTNALIDLNMIKEISREFSNSSNMPVIAVDNTYMGPIWSQPLRQGADLVLYSATKFIGGHSDVIAGACLGSKKLMSRIKALRIFLGNMTGPWEGWLLMRSLETLKIRMEKQAENAEKVAQYLNDHSQVQKVYYLGNLKRGTGQYKIYKKQFSGAGSMISFDIKGGEKSAFKFLNNLQLFKLAVSLGSTESLAEHPYTMTHSDVLLEEKKALNLTEKMIRLSIGVEDADDLISDLQRAFSAV